MPYTENTTWTMGRILDRLLEAGEEVVVFAGHHAHRGVIRAVGEYLLTLQSGTDVIAVDLASVSTVQLIGGALALPEGVVDLADDPADGGVDDDVVGGVDDEKVTYAVVPDEVPDDLVQTVATVPAGPSEEELLAAEAARRTEELQNWVRQLRDA